MDYIPNKEFMKRAIELSKTAGVDQKTGGVFGAVVVKDNQIIAEGYNQVILTNDPTWHAEIHAIRQASEKLGSPHMKGAILYTSAYPCPMCLAACYWAHIDHVFYAATVDDAMLYGNFKDLDFYQEINKSHDERLIKTSQYLRDEAVEIWKEFSKLPNKAQY